jgi:hypothetical protein
MKHYTIHASPQERVNAFQDKMAALAVALGWSFDERSQADSDWRAALKAPCGKSVWIIQQGKRLNISGDYGNISNCERTSIMVNPDRTPESIAKDIMRRFWPDYEKTHAAAMELKMKRDEYDAREKGYVSKVCEMVVGSVNRDNTIRRYATSDGIHIEAQVTGGSVKLTLSGDYKNLEPVLMKLKEILISE